MLVVDDGSDDGTAEIARAYADDVISHAANKGKGEAMNSGWRRAKGDIVLFADADLGDSARHLEKLIVPLEEDRADMAVARFAVSPSKGGFGFAKALARHGIERLTGYRTEAPLSGQRAVRRRVLEQIGGLSPGYGAEVGLTVDVLRRGYCVCEIDLPLGHREYGKTWNGFLHRGTQMIDIGRTLFVKWREPLC